MSGSIDIKDLDNLRPNNFIFTDKSFSDFKINDN